MKKTITINKLARSALGFAVIFGACAAIFVGVDGGFRSPFATSSDAVVVSSGGGVEAAPLRSALLPAR